MKSEKEFNKRASFLKTLYKILDNQEQKLAFWYENGFIINDVQQFKTEILPLYFKHGHYSSFVRSLNKHGFQIKSAESGETQFIHQSININKREMKKQKQERKLDQALNFEVEIFNMQQQIFEMRHQQRILHKEIQISLKLMEFFTKSFNVFSEVLIRTVNFAHKFSQIYSGNARKTFSNVNGELLFHKIATSKIAYPEFYDQTFVTPNQSILSTPVPFYFEMIKELKSRKDTLQFL